VAEGFTEFVSSRSQELWRAAWLLTGDPVLAEDLLQTALAKTWPHYEEVSRGGSYEAYVRRTLFTTYASWWQRRWRGEVPTATLPENPRQVSDHEAALDMRAALTELSPMQRAVVVLRYFEDLTEPEAARELGCSVGSIKTHHARAIVHLRQCGPLARLHEAP
jgi:RNA polymerase sigma-70 factor (sigma-E family)